MGCSDIGPAMQRADSADGKQGNLTSLPTRCTTLAMISQNATKSDFTALWLGFVPGLNGL